MSIAKKLKEPAASVAAGATPAMQQYLQIKTAHEDCLLFYRMGDFYELFFEDAVEAANILDIALTKRGKHAGDDIPMCGVPVHSHENYLQRLIASGRKVAICEQLETPEEAKKRGGHKAVVQREVVRIVTPGTITEETLLAPSSAHYLAALAQAEGQWAIAWLDISTGEFQVNSCKKEALASELARIAPKELLMNEDWLEDAELAPLWQEYKVMLSPLSASLFAVAKAEHSIKQHYALFALDSLGELNAADIIACGVVLDYVKLTQLDAAPRLDLPAKMAQQTVMVIDAATRQNLELMRTLSGDKKGSVLDVIDHTQSNAGGRLLAAWLTSPLCDVNAINARLDGVAAMVERHELREALRAALRNMPDIERALSRLCLSRGGPRDMLIIARGLEVAQDIRQQLILYQNTHSPLSDVLINNVQHSMGDHTGLHATLTRALQDEVPMLARDGNFIAAGYRADLDELRSLRDDAKQVIATMQQSYAKESNISTLKIKFNNVLGYFIDITAIHQNKVPDYFIHRQTLANNLRYTTTELSETASKIAQAAGKALVLEQEIFAELSATIISSSQSIIATARILAELDVICSLAQLAVEEGYTRPNIDNSLAFDIKAGRHPVVENSLKKAGEGNFIANDTDLNEAQHLWLLTGPNMAGKSTFLRQNALIVILAQIGGFVPAEYAHIGVVDRLFSRVGAADDLARGRSTFMVEMVETATILNQSSKRSLVILDEIGRGTATYDGLSIAWAVVEYLHNQVACRGVFATHYHELTQLTSSLNALKCCAMQVKEYKGKVIFLHQVVEGAADRSYGIHVAQLAGLPEQVIERAKHILRDLESSPATLQDELNEPMPLFSYASSPSESGKNDNAALDEIHAVNPDELTPKAALEWVYALKEKIT